MTATGTNEVPRRAALTALLVVSAVFLGVLYAARALGIALGGPLSTVGALVAIALVVRREGSGPASLGLGRPKRWGPALVMFLIAFAITVFSGLVLLPSLENVFAPVPPTGRFDFLQGNPLALVLSIVGIAWFSAAFGEEVFFRGFVLPRLASVMGGGQPAWLTAVLLQAIVFGVLHHGAGGMIAAGVIGLGYGLVFWLGLRNLWPLILAHAIPDTISFIGQH